MFGNKAKHALAAAQAENAQLKAQADTLQGELAATQARLAGIPPASPMQEAPDGRLLMIGRDAADLLHTTSYSTGAIRC